jgi:hypothetical protein
VGTLVILPVKNFFEAQVYIKVLMKDAVLHIEMFFNVAFFILAIKRK